MPGKINRYLKCHTLRDDDSPEATASGLPKFRLRTPQKNAVVGGNHTGVLWLRDDLFAAGLSGFRLTAGGDTRNESPRNAVGFEPRMFWGKSRIIPMEPRSAVITLAASADGETGEDFISAFSASYQANLANLGVHAYLLFFPQTPFARPLLGPVPIADATGEFVITPHDPTALVGGSCYWAHVNAQERPLISYSVAGSMDFSNGSGYFIEYSATGTAGDPPSPESPPSGWVESATTTAEFPPDGIVLYQMFANTSAISADAVALANISSAFARLKFSFWTKSGEAKLSVVTENDTTNPLQVGDQIALFPTSIGNKRYESMSSAPSQIAADIAAFFTE